MLSELSASRDAGLEGAQRLRKAEPDRGHRERSKTGLRQRRRGRSSRRDTATDGVRRATTIGEAADAPTDRPESVATARAGRGPRRSGIASAGGERWRRPRPTAARDRGADRWGHDRDRAYRARRPRADGGDAQGRGRRPSREDRRRSARSADREEAGARGGARQRADRRRASSTCCPRATGSCGPPGTCPGPTTSTCRCRRSGKYQLRKGDVVAGKVRRRPRTTRSTSRCSHSRPSTAPIPRRRSSARSFDKLTPLFPDERFRLENGPTAVTERIIDMVAPIGKGQRGMVVSPPKAGKTTILKQIANGIIDVEPGDAPDRAARRRASRGGHRLAAHGHRPPRSSTRRSTSRPTSTSR